jgi:DNA polymerase-1
MREYRHHVAGEETSIHCIERPDDLPNFRHWLSQPHPLVAVDTETTGLDTFSRGFRLRTVQFGDGRDAWVLPVETYEGIANAARSALERLPRITIHNAPYDWLVLDRHLGVPMETLAPRTLDTRILAHLLDPRGKPEGGTGHGLKDLAALWVDENAPDTQDGLHAVFRSIGHTKATGWAAIPISHPVYTLYAGLDVILTTRLAEKLEPRIAAEGLTKLAQFEHEVARVCAAMERTGFLVDRDYCRTLSAGLDEDAEKYTAEAAAYGVTNINSTKQIADALTAMGEELTERTASGALKVDKAVLRGLPNNPLAGAILSAKRAAKWKVAYADAILDLADEDGRLHPKINSLQARTGRMSISHPPLQQLPSGDGTIRRALIAEPGHLVCSVDFSAVEMRILAALARDETMMGAIARGEDLHSFTAAQVFGPDFTPKHRKIAKGIGFGKVYGGGAETISRQTGAPIEDVQRAIAAYDRTYKGVKRYSRRLQQRGEHGARAVETPSGRRLPLDRDRLYAATNYVVQSTARDVFAQALLALDEAGLTPHLRLPVHDETVFCAPENEARELCEAVQDCMTMPDFFGVPLDTEAEIFTHAWEPDKTTHVRTGNAEWVTK